jgi:hypothetical protein
MRRALSEISSDRSGWIAAETTMELILWSSGSAHARRLDEALGGIVDVAAGSDSGRMNANIGAVHQVVCLR